MVLHAESTLHYVRNRSQWTINLCGLVKELQDKSGYPIRLHIQVLTSGNFEALIALVNVVLLKPLRWFTSPIFIAVLGNLDLISRYYIRTCRKLSSLCGHFEVSVIQT